MKMHLRRTVSLLLTMALLCACIPSVPVSAQSKSDYIIDFVSAKSAAAFTSRKPDAEPLGTDETLVAASLSAREASALRNSGSVQALEADIPVFANGDGQTIPIVSRPEELPWNASAVGADTARRLGYAGQGVRVAVLDSGLDPYSEVAAAGGVDLVDPEYGTADDMTGHGTAVAGVLAAPENGQGLIGAASEAELYVVRVLDAQNTSPVSRILSALDWCIGQEMDVVNMSFGTAQYSALLEEKCRQAAEAGIVLVASAGNGTTAEYPARFADVIGVSAVNSRLEPVADDVCTAELAAPGENICSDSLLGGYGVCSGSSMASPHIAAAAAVLLSRDPDASSALIRALLAASARGAGVPDLGYALKNMDAFAARFSAGARLPQNTADAPAYDAADGLVTGSWSTAGHDGLADNYYGGTADNIRFPLLIKRVSASMDAHFGSDKLLHGVSNYIAAAQLLYEIAMRYKQYGVSRFSHENYRPDLAPILGQNAYDTLLTDVTRTLSMHSADVLAPDAADRANGATSFASVSEKTSVIVLGMFFHLVGDVYAHRTVVPPMSIQNTSCTSHGSGSGGNEGLYFVQSDFAADCTAHTADRTEVINARYRSTLDDLWSQMQSAEGFLRILAGVHWAAFLLFGRWILRLTDTGGDADQAALDAALLQSAINIPSNATNGRMCGAHASCYGAMMRLAGMGVLQFKDIKYFLDGMELYNATGETGKAFSSNRNYYEDQAPGNTFYARRYLLAKAVTQHYLSAYAGGMQTFDPYYLLAEPYGTSLSKFCLKLDQYYNYLLVLNSGSELLTRAFWAGKSNSLFCYTTIVYEGAYFIDASTYPEAYGKPTYAGVFPARTDGRTADSFYVR